MSCSACGEHVSRDLEIRWDECPHVMHNDCLPKGVELDFNKCHSCLSGAAATLRVAAAPPDGHSEPRPLDGHDYVLHPGVKVAPSLLGAVAAWVPGLKRTPVVEDPKTSQDPFVLLKHGIKIPTIIKRNKLGLQHFLKAGVEMIDFLKNGYTWDDLQAFEDISKKGPQRALQAITVGLKANANHFRDYPGAFPFQRVQQATGFEPKALCINFGLVFPDDERLSLECNGDQVWTAKDCVNMGLTIDDLIDFGMCNEGQYATLMMGLTTAEIAKAEEDLGMTLKHMALLAERQEPAAQPARQELAQPAPVSQPQPPAAVAQPKKKITHTPPPVAAAAAAPIPKKIPLERRFDRHGLRQK